MRWDNLWFLTAFKSVDPNGFLRRQGFILQSSYLYRDIPTGGGLSSVLDEIEGAHIEIVNRDQLLNGTLSPRLVRLSRKGGLKRLQDESRQAVSAAMVYQVEFYTVTINNELSMLMTDNLSLASKEAAVLKKKSFKVGEPFWSKPMTRSKLQSFFKKLQDEYKDLKIARWEQFKESARSVFSVDLKDFDEMGD